MKKCFLFLISALCLSSSVAFSTDVCISNSVESSSVTSYFPSVELFNNDWLFALGDASSMEKDFTHGTEYFSYICKVKTTNQGHAPIMPEFEDKDWQKVSLPHDWVVDLPYNAQASHSHGYKCVGWKYPQNSVGWYRKHFSVPAQDKGKQIRIEFEGIYRDSEVFCNGFYLGHEVSGYTSKYYDLTPYLNYGGENVITVRCDASLEEGWYYEGAGIYRNVRIHKSGPVAFAPYSLKIETKFEDGLPYIDASCVSAEYIYDWAEGKDASKLALKTKIFDAQGREVERATSLWSLNNPYLYEVQVSLYYDGVLSDFASRKVGVRKIEFSTEKGLLLNEEVVKLKGCNLHLDHAGVGVAVPDELWKYRVIQLQKYGFNAIRTSHNNATPSMLDACDELGMLVIDENRVFGVNQEMKDQLANMINRDRNHPCVILWSVGNEEWAVEHGPIGTQIALKMSEFVHELDPTRPSTYGNAGGPDLVKGVDVLGYNYIIQNPVDKYHELFPHKCAVGTEETSGCGTRGKYETVAEKGWMTPYNRTGHMERINVIEHGWKFYKERPWAIGLFYWTGQDYRGEPNPMSWPATGSQFGILDYCCFPKDEAYYLRSVWCSEPMVHICGPYNGEVWVYSNCDEVQLLAGKKSLGKKAMPKDGHLVFDVKGLEDSKFTAKGYIKSKKVAQDIYPFEVEKESYVLSKNTIKSDGQDVVIIDIFTPSESIEIKVENGEFLGWGNGDPGFKYIERPVGDSNSLTIYPFVSCCQVIVRSLEGSSGQLKVQIGQNEVLLDIE